MIKILVIGVDNRTSTAYEKSQRKTTFAATTT